MADGSGKLKVGGKAVSARRIAWELAHGPVPSGAVVRSCPDETACVRVDHLTLRGAPDESVDPQLRNRRGGGSKTEVRPGVWKLTVSAGRYEDGRQRRLHRTVQARTGTEATRALADFVAEVHSEPLPDRRTDRDVTIDDAIEQFLTEQANQAVLEADPVAEAIVLLVRRDGDW